MDTEFFKANILLKLAELNLQDLFTFSTAPYDIVISGSFITQCILNENYENESIDIYIKDITIYSNIIQYMYLIGGLYLSSNSYYHSKLIGNKTDKYITPHADINIHLIKGDIDTISYINKISEFDICTSYFDGYHLYFPLNLLTKRVNIINFCKINENYNEMLTEFLINNFGDPLINKNYFLFNLDSYCYRILRIEKYKARGFTFNDYKLESLIPNYQINKSTISSAHIKYKFLQKLAKESILKLLILCLEDIPRLENTHLWNWSENKLVYKHSLVILCKDKKMRELWRLDK
jgi:hypothetical protein